MKSDYTHNKRIWGVVTMLAILLGLGAYVYYYFHTTREDVAAAMARIEICHQYELELDGKVLLLLEKDTNRMNACFADKYTGVPSCKGRLITFYRSDNHPDKYHNTTAQAVYQETIQALDSIYNDSKWKVAELSYYIDSHNVTDEGFTTIYQYTQKEKALCDSAKHLLDSLKHVKQTDRLKIVHHTEYKAFYHNELGKWVSELGSFVQKESNQDFQIFQLTSQKTPQGVKALAKCQAAGYARLSNVMFQESIDLTIYPDSLGYYNGNVDSRAIRQGHGIWQGKDGTYYEGAWENGKRNGFGFTIAPKKPLRVGEWKNDTYKGERLVYTSERIYGIDISKYQHISGKKRYSIDWNKLRISHLGSISRKTVTGTVNYPINFIYIKSTEGATLLNPYYKKDYRAAKAHGFRVGSYHFFSPTSPAALQARQFLKHAQINKGDFPPVLDVEPLPSQIKKMGGAQVLFARVRIWLKFVEREVGIKPILYINQPFVNKYLNQAPDLKHNYKIWIARYGEYKPDIHLVYWQLCPDGRVSGIHGYVDINVFNGYKDAYDKFVKEEVVK